MEILSAEDLKLEIQHAEFMVNFYKTYKHTAHQKYNNWIKKLNYLLSIKRIY